MKIKNRFLHYFLLAIVVASALTTTLSPIVSAKPLDAGGGSAASLPVDSMTASQAAKSWLYYYALSACVNKDSSNGGGNHTISELDAKSGKWFADLKLGAVNPALGYFLKGMGLKTSDDKIGCGGDNTDWIIDAIKMWGYKDGLEAVCAFGRVRANGLDCTLQGNGDFSSSTLKLADFQMAIKTKVYGLYGATQPTMGPESWYVLYRNSFDSGCIGSVNPPAYTGSGSDQYMHTFTRVDPTTGESKVTKYLSKVPRKPSDTIKYYTDSTLNNVEKSCAYIARQGDKYASAYSDWVIGHPLVSDQGSDKSQNTAGPATSSCAVDGIGWIVCPVLTFLGKLADGSFAVVQAFLIVKPINMDTGDTTNSLYTAWSVIRNIANVAFVIAFLIIIFSQITSVGVTNYGVKKILPRLVVAAILVNLSFFVSALLVDVSNVLGSSIGQVFEFITNQTVVSAPKPTWVSIVSTVLGATAGAGVIAGGMTAAVMAAGGATAALAALLPIMVVALIALVVAFVVLIARQALIVILIVLSPLAFVAYLLPNTEKWFKKWYTTFSTMLFLYPMIALLYGGAGLASAILLQNASNGGDNGAVKFFMTVGALGVQVIPLIAVVSLIKSSSGMLGKVSGMAQKLSKKPGDGLGAMAGSAAKNAKNRDAANNVNRRVMGWGTRRKNFNQKKSANIEAEANRAIAARSASDILDTSTGYAEKIAGSSDPLAVGRVQARAQGEQRKMNEEEIQNITALDDRNNWTAAQHLGRLNNTASTANERAASIRRIGEIGGMGEVNQLAALAGAKIPGTGTIDPATGAIDRTTMENYMHDEDRREIQAVAGKRMGTDNPSFGGASISEMGTGNFDSDAAYSRYISGLDFSANSFLSMKEAAKTAVIERINRTPAGSTERAAMIRVRDQINSTPELEARAAGTLMADLGAITL